MLNNLVSIIFGIYVCFFEMSIDLFDLNYYFAIISEFFLLFSFLVLAQIVILLHYQCLPSYIFIQLFFL